MEHTRFLNLGVEWIPEHPEAHVHFCNGHSLVSSFFHDNLFLSGSRESFAKRILWACYLLYFFYFEIVMFKEFGFNFFWHLLHNIPVFTT